MGTLPGDRGATLADRDKVRDTPKRYCHGRPDPLLRDMSKYEPDLDQCFSALGDPTRRGILQRLAQGEATVSELAAPHDMALPSFMEHIRKLETARLLTSRKEGRTRICALAPDAFAPAQDWLTGQRAIWEGRLDRFDAYVTQLARDRTP